MAHDNYESVAQERAYHEDYLRLSALPFTARRFAHFFSIDWRFVENIKGGLGGQRELLGSFAPERMQEIDHEAHLAAESIIKACQSPLEELFVSTFLMLNPFGNELRPRFAPGVTTARQSRIFEWCTVTNDEWSPVVWVMQQEPAASYKIDFSVHAPGLKLAIELDGHDFHERTKGQAQRDKSRDRKLTELGHRVVRFTGSEVWRDPAKCCFEVHSIIESIGSKAQ